MDLKKIFSTGALALIVDFVTEWTKLLHTDYFVHPDWQKAVDADARLFSVVAVILLYITIHNWTRRALTPTLVVLIVVLLLLLGICIYIHSVLPDVPKVDAANSYIRIWRWFFIAADVAAVCIGATFGLWLVAE
jgi:hypothetical protein